MNRSLISKKLKLLKIVNSAILICVVSYFLCLVLHAESFYNDPGFLWHLKDGENILTNFKIPYFDEFLSIKRAWISDQWLSDCILYLIYTIGNFSLIFYVYAALCMAFIYLFYRKLVLLKYSNNLSSLIATLFILLFLKIHFIARPVFFSFCLLVLLIFLIEKYKNATTFRKLNFEFFLLFLFWANIHPSFFIGFFLWGMVVVEKFLKDYKSFDYKNYILTSFIIFVATLINPYFINLHESILLLSNSKFFMSLNDEWKPIKPFNSVWIFCVTVQSLIIGFYIFCKNFRVKIGLAYIISSLTFFVYALKHQRGVTYFAILAAIPLSNVIFRILTLKITKNIYLIRLLPKFLRNANICLKSKKIDFFIILIFFACISVKNHYKDIKFEPNLQEFPYGVCNYIEENNLKGNIFASPNYGGFLIWHLKNMKPIIDDRNTMLGEKSYKDYLESVETIHGLIKHSKKQNAPYILITKGNKLYKRLLQCSAFRVLFKEGKFALLKIRNY